MPRLKRALTLTAMATAVAATLPAAPAHALVIPPMNLTLTTGVDSHTVCASGGADPTLYVAGDWELVITGTRTIGLPIEQTASSTSRTFFVCQAISKDGALQGQYHVSFTFTGAGLDVIGKKTGFGSWSPGVGDSALSI